MKITLEAGGVYALGNNTYGELGLENCVYIEKPYRLKFFDKLPGKAVKIATGARHSLVLLDNGDLYSFGDNSEGQCTGNNARYSTPYKVVFDFREKVIDIYSNYNHTLMMSGNLFIKIELGDIYTWGDSTSGKLGYAEGNLISKQPRLIQVCKGKYANCIGIGPQMTVISMSSYENSIVCRYKKNEL